MKMSMFNVYRESGEDLFIYNTLSGGVLHLNEEYSRKFKIIKEDTELIKDFPDLLDNLKKGSMIIEDIVNERDMILTYSNMIRFSNETCTLTLAPTMKCNFVCPYCYEVDKSYPKMNQNIIDKIKEYIKEKKEAHKYLSIAWYGGEPLLAFDIIEELSLEAIKIFGDKYYACMVTNGYLFTDDIIKELKSLHIYDIQITLDGPPEIHNKRRKLPNGEDTFFKILENIKKIVGLFEDVHITVRVNTDKENVDYIDEILTYLEEYNIREKISLYLAPVDNINNTCNNATCLDNIEFAQEQLKFIERNWEKGYNYFNLPCANLGICGAIATNNYVIDALGDVYKCWDDIACPDRKVGNILQNESYWVNKNLTDWLAYDIRYDEECMNCSFLPVCMGGCPNHRLRNKQKKCFPIKENAEELIRVLYKISSENGVRDDREKETEV